jgi:hypothetical protein
MPNKNGTGPEGKGPKTGRGLGTCGDGVDNAQGNAQGPGQGRGQGRGQGMGMRRRVNTPRDNS